MLGPTLNDSPLQIRLRSDSNLEKLTAELGIKCKRHPIHHNLVLFVYNQIDSPKMNPIVQASRGHILDEADNWNHVCRPFDLFLNFGEGVGQQLQPDFSKSVLFKKEDGSLINVWWWDGEWQVSTKGMPDAGGEVGDYNLTFDSLFRRVSYDTGLDWEGLNKNYTYTFELCTPYNRVVCTQTESRIVLLAVRNNLTGQELDPAFVASGLCVDVPESYDFTDADSAIKSFMHLNPLDNEGYVACEYLPDGRVIRTKVKHPGYIALSHLKEGITRKRLLELKRLGEDGEFLAVFPEYSGVFNEVSERFEKRVQVLEVAWKNSKNIESQKDFALAVKDLPSSSVLFSLRRYGRTVREELSICNLDGLYTSLGFRD